MGRGWEAGLATSEHSSQWVPWLHLVSLQSGSGDFRQSSEVHTSELLKYQSKFRLDLLQRVDLGHIFKCLGLTLQWLPLNGLDSL